MRRSQVLYEEDELLTCGNRNLVVKAGFAVLLHLAAPNLELNEDRFLELIAERLGKKVT